MLLLLISLGVGASFILPNMLETDDNQSDDDEPDATIDVSEHLEHSLQVGAGEFTGSDGDDHISFGDDAYSQPLNSWDRVEVYAGSGDDIILGPTASPDGSQNIYLIAYGGEGADAFYGGDTNDNFNDTDGTNIAFGHGGNDIFNLGSNNTGVGGIGHDRLFLEDDGLAYGGEGNDIVELGNASTGYGGGGQDRLTAGDRAIVTGGSGDDTLILGADGSAYGGDGADNFFIGDGSSVYGGSGNDSYNFSLDLNSTEAVVIADFVSGEDEIVAISVTGVAGENTDLEIELQARADGSGTDMLINGRILLHALGANPSDFGNTQFQIDLSYGGQIFDGSGGTTISGQDNEFQNTIFGNGGDDSLLGGVGDILYGGDGDDILSLGDGATATGGTGADTFVLTYAASPVIVTDFDETEDVICIDIGNDLLDDGTYVLDYLKFEVEPWTDGSGADITLNGHVFANVFGGQNLQVSELEFK